MRLEGGKALVTGGNAGIGRALTGQLVGAGMDVVICGRDASSLNETCAAYPGRVTAIRADLSRPGDVAALCDEIVDLHSDMSLLINNAGIQQYLDFFAPEAGDLCLDVRREVEVNFCAVAVLCARLMPVLQARGEGAIVNISSGLAIAPKEAAPVYCATKAAVRTLTKALRYQAETNGGGVKVIDVVMTLVDTAMTAGRGRGKISADQAAAEIIAGVKAGRQEIWVGKTKLLRLVNRLSPRLADRLLRGG